MNKQLQIHMGALCPSIETQLRKQGLLIPNPEESQADADAITRLAIRGLLTDAEKHRARNRLIAGLCRNACVALLEREGQA